MMLNIKKPIAILFGLILCLCLVFSACGEKPDDTDKTCGSDGKYGQSDDEQTENSDSQNGEITEMYIYVNGNRLEVTLAENSSVDALVNLLKQEDIIYTAHVNSFEIYGDIGHSLPTNNAQITSHAGDVFLWAGDNLCIFFGNNKYSYTRIGKIEGYTAQQLKTMFGSGDVQVTISLKQDIISI